MNAFWRFLRDKHNQQVLGWLGGGLVVALTGLWVAFVYFFPSGKSPEAKSSEPMPRQRPGRLWWRRHRRQRDWRDHHGGNHNQFGLRIKTEMRCLP